MFTVKFLKKLMALSNAFNIHTNLKTYQLHVVPELII